MKGVRKFTWLFGFLGFIGFQYFKTHNPGDLVWFMFFGFFAFFFIRKVNTAQMDEMYEANMGKAARFVLFIPLVTVFIIAYGAGQWGFDALTIMGIAMASYVLTLMAYAFKLWQLERGA